jgi:hypothetical protein
MTEILYCANHPKIETNLRCNRCEKPICTRCAVLTPTGYRCKECVRDRLKVFDNAAWYHHLLALVTAGLLSAVASFVILFISGFFFGLLVLLAAPAAGALIARGVHFVVRRRRARLLFSLAAAGVALGALPVVLSEAATLLLYLRAGYFSIWWLLPLIWQAVYLVIAVPAVYTQLSGIRLR